MKKPVQFFLLVLVLLPLLFLCRLRLAMPDADPLLFGKRTETAPTMSADVPPSPEGEEWKC